MGFFFLTFLTCLYFFLVDPERPSHRSVLADWMSLSGGHVAMRPVFWGQLDGSWPPVLMTKTDAQSVVRPD